jgi:6-phosphogluconolactonase (cycloisomerase 2 family)
MSMRTLRDVAKFALPLILMLVLCGHHASGSEAGNPARQHSKTKAGHEMLYGFPLTLRLNVGVTARIDPTTGEFHPVSSGLVPFFANSEAVVSNAQFLYVSNSFIDGQPDNGSQILGYSISPRNGKLTPISEPSFFRFPSPISIQGLAATPDGRFLYGANYNGSIYAFRVNKETGILDPIPGSPFASGANPQLAIDPTGRFLYASNDDSPGSVLAFTIDSTGALTPIPGSPFAIPASTIVPNTEPYGILDTGRFVYVALSATNRIAAFSADSQSGVLTPVAGSPFAAGNFPIVFASLGEFLYVVNASDGSISGYRSDPNTGALAPVLGSPFGTDSGALAIDPSGKYLYSGRGSGIQSYNIDSQTGALTLGPERFGEDGVLGLTIVELSAK